MKLFPLKTLYKYLALISFLAFYNGSVLGQIDFEILSGDALICLGDSTQLSIDAEGIDSIMWSPTTGVSMVNSLTTSVSPAQSTSYFATLYSGELIQNIRIEVDVISAPDLGNDLSVCSNNGMLNFDLNNVAVPTAYTLTNSGNFIIFETAPNNFAVNINNTPAGTYDLIANSIACNQSDTIQIIVLNGTAAQLDFDEPNMVVCQGTEVNFGVTPVANQTYEWFANGTSISTATNITDTPLTTTTYVIAATGGTCTVASLDSVTITVNTDPSISLPDTVEGCENSIIQLGNNINQGGTTYSWDPIDNIVDPTVINAELLVVEDGTYILTANNGCEIRDTIEVTMIPNDIDIPMDTLFLCKGGSIEITFTTNPPNDDVVWTNINGVPINNVASPFIVSPDDVVAFIGAVENNGCVFRDTVTIQVDSLPFFPELIVEEFNMAEAPICMGDTVQLITDPIYDPTLYPNITFQWFSGESVSAPGEDNEFLTPDSLVNLIFLAEETRPYTRINTNGACEDTTTTIVEVIPILEVDITPLDEVCPGTTLTIEGSGFDPVSMMNIPPEEIEWEWMVSSGTIEPEEGQFDPTLTVEGSDVQIMVTANYLGCPAMGSEVLPVFSIPSIGFPLITEVCVGDIVALNATGTVEPGFVFNWSSTANDLNGQENDPNPQVTPAGTTTYAVTVTNGVCDPVMSEVTLTVFDGASSLAEQLEVSGCAGDIVTVSLPSDFQGGPNAEFTWTPQSGQGPILTGSSVDIPLIQNTIYIITVTNNCATDQLIGQANVIVQQIPEVNIIFDPVQEEYGEGEMISLSVDPQIAGVVYTWGSANQGNFSQNPSTSTVYTVTGSNQGGTIDSDFINVVAEIGGCTGGAGQSIDIVPADVILPNVFTPGSNENNIFRLRTIGLVTVTNLQIYDRWGNKVYDNDNVAQEWDGMINGEPAPSEVYIYTVTYQIPGQDPITDSSDLTLLR